MSSRSDRIMKLLKNKKSFVNKQEYHQVRPNLFPSDDLSCSPSISETNNDAQCEVACISDVIDIKDAQVLIEDNGLFNIEGDGTLQQIDDVDGLNCAENVLGDECFNESLQLSELQSLINTSLSDQVGIEVIGLDTDIGSQEMQVGLSLIEEIPVPVVENIVFVDKPNVVEEVTEVPTHGNEENVEVNEPNISGKRRYLQTVDTNTKEGNPRKRKKYVFKPDERKKIKMTVLKEEHVVKSICSTKCKLKCSENVSEEMRLSINDQYWDLGREEQKAFVVGSITKNEVKRKTVLGDSRRSGTYQYFFRDVEGKSIQVCKTFFLTTLGFSKTNDKVLQNVCKKQEKPLVSPACDKRKGRKPHNKADHSVIRNHIESFEPAIAHYRREHAPNRRYLPSDLTILQMHENFKEKHPGVVCSYELYRSEVSKMNIAFVKLGNEECEQCEHFSFHTHKKDNLQEDCEECQSYKSHVEKASSAREAYKKDAEKVWENEEIIYSADLQKVIMLPRCDMFKSVVFTQRLSVYNESYVPVGKKREAKIGACLWHEALRGRKKEEIISTVFKFLTTEARDAKKVTLWMDNCTGQNKNWAFFTFLVFCVNSPRVCAQVIEIKYFEPGHTFMSADSFHHRVEKSLHAMKKVYDFNDFKTAVERSSTNVTVLDMKLEDFYEWKDFSYTRKKEDPRPYIKDLVQVKAIRGENILHYTVDMNENSEWKDLDFLNKKSKTKGIPFPSAVQRCRGISLKRKEGILDKLVTGKNSIVPENRLEFWNYLPTTTDDDLGDEN